MTLLIFVLASFEEHNASHYTKKEKLKWNISQFGINRADKTKYKFFAERFCIHS